jgi:hypothetical protein
MPKFATAFFVFAVACSVTLVAAVPSKGSATSPVRFENAKQGIRFAHPVEWTVSGQTSNANLSMNLTFRIEGSKTALAYVVVTPAVAKDPQREQPLIVKRTLDRVRASFQKVEAAQAETTVGGKAGTRMMTAYNGPVGATRQVFYVVARGEKTYVFSYSAGKAEFDAGMKDLERLMESVEWTE